VRSLGPSGPTDRGGLVPGGTTYRRRRPPRGTESETETETEAEAETETETETEAEAESETEAEAEAESAVRGTGAAPAR
jgi:hypothetical protein